ncbi:MAG: alpha/beta fold hydrolase [Gammaproteobacteria bacterium]|nr:alpha/beta fold hydrolase [Gammaproteobacteria bacterium]
MPHATIDLQGPEGSLEARIDEVSTPQGIAVLCHPHPQYGGNMHDSVLAFAAGAMLAAGLNCLRFNFRGVGSSAGRHDDGNGEVEDVLAAMAFARQQQPRGPLWLLGYSFGACMAWAAARQQAPDGLILIAPPVDLMDFSGGLPAEVGVHVLLGDRDDFAPVDSVQHWAESLEPAARVRVVNGSDHFFHGHGQTLEEAVRGVITAA